MDIPCKLGDEMWGIRYCGYGKYKVYKGKVSEVFFGEDYHLCVVLKGICRGEVGRRIFHTQEEAYNAMERAPFKRTEE